MVKWISLDGFYKYNDALELMEEKLINVINGDSNEAIFLLQHEDIYTAGTNYKEDELIDKTSIPVIYTGRGGKFTYHGPGQLVIYPVLDLKKTSRKQDIKDYVRKLESWVINSLARINVSAHTIDGMVGIWVTHNKTPAKIAAIGVRIKKWVTYHGIAINISTDLTNYSGIIPCGINDFPVTSLNEIGVKISIKEFSSILKDEFNKIF